MCIQITLLQTSPPSLGRDTLGLGTPGTLWAGHSGTLWHWARARDCGVGHSSRQTLGLGTPGGLWGTLALGTPGRVWGWALQGRETLGLGTPGTLWGWAIQESLGWALQGDSGVGHSRDIRDLGTPGTFGVGHSRDERGLDRARRRVPGEEKSFKSNNPTPRVVNKFKREGSRMMPPPSKTAVSWASQDLF